jgi:beta-galactosidase
LPPNLYGAEWIRMPVISSSELLPAKWASFKVTAEADVFIALDTAITQLPDWMKDFEDTKNRLENTLAGGHSYKIYRKRFPAQSTVALGPNGRGQGGSGMMYTVIVTPVTTLQPAFDLKPVTGYKMPQAVVSDEGTARQTINNREAVVFTKPTDASVAFTIDVGVADMYSLSFRYYSATAATKKATWQLIAADGTVMKTELMEFTTTREGKWNYFSTTTGTMINAGKYTVRITAEDAAGVAIGGLDVQ